MKFKFRFASQIVGVFVIVAVLFLAAILILMAVNQRWFAKNYYFTSKFASGKGLSVGMPISFRGFQIGGITKIALTEENDVEISFYIQDTFYPKVYKDSALQLATNPLGLGGGLVFHQGKEAGPPLEEFSYIPSLDMPEGRLLVKKGLVNIPKDEDAINRLLGEVEPILNNVNQVLLSVLDTLDTLNASLAGSNQGPLGGILADTKKITGNVNVITKDLSQSIDETMKKTNELLGNLSGITGNLEATTGSLRDPTGLVKKLIDPKGSIATFLDDNDRLFNQIEGILKGVNESVGQLKDFAAFVNTTRPQLLGTIEEGRQAIKQGQDVLQGLKNNPLLRGGITPSMPIPNAQQGYRDEDF